MQELITLLDPERLVQMVVDFLPRLGAAAVVFFAFWLLVRITRPTLRMVLHRADLSETLINLLVDNLYRFALLILGLVMAVSQLGINVGAALAGIGVIGIAVGFAAQDSVGNMIAGFLILWDKPFRVGDMIETQGRYGAVTSITMRTTRIRTPDNTYLVLPNRMMIEDYLVNHSMFGRTRVQVPVGIAYKEDVREARAVILEAVRSVEGILRDPEPDVVVTELGDSSVNLSVRVWTEDAAEERPAHFRTLEACKVALDEAGIEIPFPHLQLFLENVENRVWDKAARLSGADAAGAESAS
jgi:small conductance mechanosensitive channel